MPNLTTMMPLTQPMKTPVNKAAPNANHTLPVASCNHKGNHPHCHDRGEGKVHFASNHDDGQGHGHHGKEGNGGHKGHGRCGMTEMFQAP